MDYILVYGTFLWRVQPQQLVAFFSFFIVGNVQVYGVVAKIKNKLK